MPVTLPFAVPLALVIGVALAPAAATAAATAKQCRSLTVQGSEITRVRATGVTCTEARRQAGAWARSDDCNPVTGNPEDCSLRRYTCTSSEGPGFGTTVVCRRSTRRVSFRIGPA